MALVAGTAFFWAAEPRAERVADALVAGDRAADVLPAGVDFFAVDFAVDFFAVDFFAVEDLAAEDLAAEEAVVLRVAVVLRAVAVLAAAVLAGADLRVAVAVLAAAVLRVAAAVLAGADLRVAAAVLVAAVLRVAVAVLVAVVFRAVAVLAAAVLAGADLRVAVAVLVAAVLRAATGLATGDDLALVVRRVTWALPAGVAAVLPLLTTRLPLDLVVVLGKAGIGYPYLLVAREVRAVDLAARAVLVAVAARAGVAFLAVLAVLLVDLVALAALVALVVPAAFVDLVALVARVVPAAFEVVAFEVVAFLAADFLVPLAFNASLNAVAALNLTALRGPIFTAWLVRGLRPMRPSWCLGVKVPNWKIETLLPALTSDTTVSTMVFNTSSALRLSMPVALATRSTNSDRFTCYLLKIGEVSCNQRGFLRSRQE